MKKTTQFFMVLLALFLMIPSTRAGDVSLYNSGNIATSDSAYVVPAYFGGAGWAYDFREMDLAKKDTAFFPEVLNVTDSIAYGIELSRTDDSTGVNFLSLRLPSCDSIYVEAWGTGGRGILITNDVTADSVWAGSSSYTLFSVSKELNIADSVTIKITPTGKDSLNSYSNGGTWINRIVVYRPYAFTATETGAVASTLNGLTDALGYTGYTTSDITIELMNNTDESGVYLLGNSGFAFPQTGGNITIKNAEGQNPVLAGRLTSTNGVKAATMLYEGLEFNGDSVKTKYTSDTYSPFYFRAKDSIMTAMVVRNCTFRNLPIQQLILSTNKFSTGMLVEEFIMEHSLVENCGVDNDTTASQSGHFFYIKDAATYEFDKFTFRNNIINSWRNSQAFNIGRSGTTDTIAPEFRVAIENNTFYKFGGNGTNARQFIGYGKSLGGHDATIDINNNIFYERGSLVGFPHSKLSLPTTLDSTQVVTVNLLNNLFYPNDVVASNPVYTPEDTTYFDNLTPDGDSAIIANINRNDLFMSDFPGLELNLESKLSYKLPIYTAGTNGTYLGSVDSYYVPAFIEQPTGAVVKNLQELTEALAYTDYESTDLTIELENCTDEGGVYLLDNDGFAFPQTGGNITIRNAEGQNPVLAGRLTSTNGVKAATMLYEGLEFNGDSVKTKYTSDTYSPFYFRAKDSIMTAMVVRNCTFRNLPIQQLILSTNKFSTGMLVEEFIMEHSLVENCGVDNDTTASQSGHFFYIKDAATYEFDKFTFRDNIVNTWRNSQAFNIGRAGTTDTIAPEFRVAIENNTFYKFGGNGTNARQFIGYGKSLGGHDATIDINNNIFYERGSQAGFPHSRLALPGELDSAQVVTVNLLNNLFYPNDVVASNPVTDPTGTTYFDNLTPDGHADIIAGINRNDLFMSDFPGMELDLESKLSYKLPIFAAGTEGTYLGSIDSYYVPAFIEQPTGAIVKNLQELTEALAYTDYESADITIELENCTDEGGVYLLGNSGLTFPQTGNNLTIKNAEGHSPVLAGRLSSSNGVKAATLLYEGLEFNAESVYDAYNVKTFSPIYMNKVDSVMTALVVRNCTFRNLPLTQLVMSANDLPNNSVVKDFVMERCLIKDMGVNQDTVPQHSGHMIQIANKNTIEFDHFTFRNNIVDNWRNSQVFNIPRDGTTADSTDVNFVVNIENNLFYKFGGNATNTRNFLEYNKSLGGLAGIVNINNNIFYERGGQIGFPHAKLTLLEPKPGQSVTLNVMNNLFYPENVVMDQSTPEVYPNLRLVGPAEEDITFNRNDLFMNSFEGLSKVFRNEARLTISKQSELFTAGTGETFLGAEQCYVGNAGTPVVAYITKQKTMAATAATVENDPVYLMMAKDDNFVVDLIALTDVSATSPVDLDAYDIALVQEAMGGGDKILTPAGPLGLAKFDLPVLYNKTYAFKAGRAFASGQAGSGAEQQGLTITVDPAQQGNDLFKGLTFAEDNTLALFKVPTTDDGTVGAEKSVKALNYAKEVVLSDANTLIAIPTGVTDAVICINDLPAGTVVGGQTLAERMITLGFNFGAICAENGTNMTNAAFTIWRNALYMLAGLPVPADPYDALPQTDSAHKNMVFTMGGNLYVQAAEQTSINIYNVMGALVRTVRLEQGLNTIEGLSQGQVYVVKTDSEVVKVVL